MNRSNKIPEGRRSGNLVHSLCLRNEFTCRISYFALSLLASVVRLRINVDKHMLDDHKSSIAARANLTILHLRHLFQVVRALVSNS